LITSFSPSFTLAIESFVCIDILLKLKREFIFSYCDDYSVFDIFAVLRKCGRQPQMLFM